MGHLVQPPCRSRVEEPGSVLSVPSLQVVVTSPRSLLLSGPVTPRSLRLASREPRPAPSASVRPFALPSMSTSLVYWGAQHWAQHAHCGLTSAEERGRVTSFNPSLPRPAQATVMSHLRRITGSLVSVGTPGPFHRAAARPGAGGCSSAGAALGASPC